MGAFWIIGTCWIIYEIAENLFAFKEYKILKEYFMLAFCLIMGFLFCYKGKVKSVVFDK